MWIKTCTGWRPAEVSGWKALDWLSSLKQTLLIYGLCTAYKAAGHQTRVMTLRWQKGEAWVKNPVKSYEEIKEERRWRPLRERKIQRQRETKALRDRYESVCSSVQCSSPNWAVTQTGPPLNTHLQGAFKEQHYTTSDKWSTSTHPCTRRLQTHWRGGLTRLSWEEFPCLKEAKTEDLIYEYRDHHVGSTCV